MNMNSQLQYMLADLSFGPFEFVPLVFRMNMLILENIKLFPNVFLWDLNHAMIKNTGPKMNKQNQFE